MVPKACIPAVLEIMDSVHNGADRACLQAQRSYYWYGLKSDVSQNFKDCVTLKLMFKKPKQESILLTDPSLSIGHTQAVDFASVGEKEQKKK